MKKLVSLVLAFLTCIACVFPLLTGCGSKKERIVIWTSAEDFRIEDMQKRFGEQFPDYEIVVDYKSTGDIAARLLAEGTDTECDIVYSLEYGYLSTLAAKNYLASLKEYDMSVFEDDVVTSEYYVVDVRNGGAVILNPAVLEEKGLTEPTCYADLLKPEYKGYISMPSPKSSGTGYMFLKNLVNAWGEEEAFAYFDQLTPNILAYTTSGSGPVNALCQKEVAVGLGMTAQAVQKINEGENLKIVYFEEGSPYSLYGHAMVKGKEQRACVKQLFDFIVGTYIKESNGKFFPEQIIKGYTPTVKNYPANIKYGDMSNDTPEEKTRLLGKWKY